MRLSDFSGRKIVNFGDGSVIGVVNDHDLAIDEKSGEIISILVPISRGGLRGRRLSTVPWESVVRIGEDYIIIEV